MSLHVKNWWICLWSSNWERYLKQTSMLPEWSCGHDQVIDSIWVVFWRLGTSCMNIRWDKRTTTYYFNRCLFVCWDLTYDIYIYTYIHVICIPYMYIYIYIIYFFNILKLTPVCSSLRTEVHIQSLRLRPISAWEPQKKKGAMALLSRSRFCFAQAKPFKHAFYIWSQKNDHESRY